MKFYMVIFGVLGSYFNDRIMTAKQIRNMYFVRETNTTVQRQALNESLVSENFKQDL